MKKKKRTKEVERGDIVMFQESSMYTEGEELAKVYCLADHIVNPTLPLGEGLGKVVRIVYHPETGIKLVILRNCEGSYIVQLAECIQTTGRYGFVMEELTVMLGDYKNLQVLEGGSHNHVDEVPAGSIVKWDECNWFTCSVEESLIPDVYVKELV